MANSNFAPAPSSKKAPGVKYVFAKKILANEVRAEWVFDRLREDRDRGVPPYDVPLVQDAQFLPKGIELGSNGHAKLLLQSCFWMKGGTQSDTAIRYVSQVWERHPELFDEERFYKLEGDDETTEIQKIQSILYSNGLGAGAEKIGFWWVKNFQKLTKFWDGQVLNLFADIQTEPAGDKWKFDEAKRNYEQLVKVFKRPTRKSWDFIAHPYGFYNFRYKMVSMLTYFLVDAGMLDVFPYPVPVDIHVIRVLLETGAIYAEEEGDIAFNVDKLTAVARDVTLRYMLKTGITSEKLAELPWYLSRSHCVRNPGNASSFGTPAGRGTIVLPKPFNWTRTRVLGVKQRCGQCSIMPVCDYNVPSGPYYKHGVALRRGERPVPPDLLLESRIPVRFAEPSSRLVRIEPKPERAHTNGQIKMFDDE